MRRMRFFEQNSLISPAELCSKVAERLLVTGTVAKVLHILPGGQLEEHVASAPAEPSPAPAVAPQEESRPHGGRNPVKMFGV